MSMNTDIKKACFSLSERLLANSLHMGVAESCTGGWISKACSDQAGSSDWFEGGLVTYTNNVKENLLHVNQDTLLQYGAVSKETALAMVAGTFLTLPNIDVAVAVTGIAGPTGGTVNTPVGLVWVAYSLRARPAEARSFQFSGDRDQIRHQAVVAALTVLTDYLRTSGF